MNPRRDARALALIVVIASACGGNQPSAADQERAKAAAACDQGNGRSCFVAAVGLDDTDPAQLERGIRYWTRGCELGHAACCAQLGTVAEFGMTSGGASPDPARAHTLYALACKRGDRSSCKRIGQAVDDVTNGTASAAFPWREALASICGTAHGELGPLFQGLVPGQPMPDATSRAVAAFEKKYQAHVHYYVGDPWALTPWFLDVRFDEKDGIRPALAAAWGAPDPWFEGWTSAQNHVRASWTQTAQGSGLSWYPYRSVAEVIRPDDKTTLGFEPFPVVGAKLADLQAAMGPRMMRSGEDEYQWNEIGAGPGFEVHVFEKRGVIVELHTVNWITNSPEVGDELLAALEAKWGKPAVDRRGGHTWLRPGRRVQASKPATGNFEVVITKR